MLLHTGTPCGRQRMGDCLKTSPNRAPALLAVSRPLRPRNAHLSSPQIWMATFYLLLYGVYVAIVFRGPKGGKGAALSTGSSQDGLEVGELGAGLSDHAVDARWM